MSLEVALLFWLFIKHFIADFPLQASPWMYKNKGTYGHIGGIVHSYIHAAFTGVVVVVCLIVYGEYDIVAAQETAMAAAFFDGIVHYHIDWAKLNINKYFNLTPVNSEWFWISLGVDQLAHTLTYFAIVLYLIRG